MILPPRGLQDGRGHGTRKGQSQFRAALCTASQTAKLHVRLVLCTVVSTHLPPGQGSEAYNKQSVVLSTFSLSLLKMINGTRSQPKLSFQRLEL